MAEILELCKQVAAAKTGDVYQAVRIINGEVLALNRVNAIRFDGFDKSVDCLVSATDLLSAFSATSENRSVVQSDEVLTIKEKRVKIDLQLLPVSGFDHNGFDIPDGVEIPVESFMATLKRMVPYLKHPEARAYLLRGYAYVTNGHFIIRTPLNEQFPQNESYPVVVTTDFTDLVLKVERKPLKVLVSSDAITVFFEGGYVKSTRFNVEMPEGLAEGFDGVMDSMIETRYDDQGCEYQSSKMQPLPEDVLDNLRHMVKIATDRESINFEKSGITLAKGHKVSWHIDCEFPQVFFDPKSFGAIMATSTEYYFDSIGRKIVFEGPGIEGMWMGLASAR